MNAPLNRELPVGTQWAGGIFGPLNRCLATAATSPGFDAGWVPARMP